MLARVAQFAEADNRRGILCKAQYSRVAQQDSENPHGNYLAAEERNLDIKRGRRRRPERFCAAYRYLHKSELYNAAAEAIKVRRSQAANNTNFVM